ncbi:MAG: hypothetical protein K1X78_27840 [Verrucomicrobiaceae bacterium]|nr:hypothetical protein [Verrucomicrobiaceae bacterium]
MAFDPAIPATNAEATSAMFRGQFQGLKALIDAIPAGPAGPQGPPGDPGGPPGPPKARPATMGHQARKGHPAPPEMMAHQDRRDPKVRRVILAGRKAHRDRRGPMDHPVPKARPAK